MFFSLTLFWTPTKNIDKMISYFKYALKTIKTQNMHLYAKKISKLAL